MHDVVLRGGVVHDGLGSPAFEADVAIADGRVAAVGRSLGGARRTIDVTGLAVAPGFVDPHSHSDLVPFLAEPQPFKLLQGVTTEINGNCGFSVAPLDAGRGAEAAAILCDLVGTGDLPVRAWSFGEYLDATRTAGPTNHVATLVGHSTVRMAVNGYDRALAAGASEEMRRLAREALAEGAVGVSTGLIYPPGAYGDVDEVAALVVEAHRVGRPYATHLRDEGAGLEDALDEAVEIARRARVRLQISHCKAAGRSNHGKSELLLAKLRAVRVAGVDARGDAYPYLAGGTALSALLPPEALERDPALERLSDPGERSRLRRIAEDSVRPSGAGLWRDCVPDGVLLTGHRRADVVGRTLADAAAGRDPWEVACELILADPSSTMVITMMAEDDVRRILADPLIGIGSDNGIPTRLEHPRTWGCFPHFLGRYVREVGLVDWPEAVRKVTSAAASRFGLAGRGWLGPGAFADVCVFDLATVGHEGTYERPDVAPSGIPYVLLEGLVIVDGGEFVGGRHGRVIQAATDAV